MPRAGARVWCSDGEEKRHSSASWRLWSRRRSLLCRDYDVAEAGLGTIIWVTVPVLPRRLSTLVMVVVSTAVAVVAQTPAREAHAALNGVRIWYSDTGGRGEPIVLLHAATGSSRVWEHQLPAFTASGYRVIAYDRRGFGRSEIDSTGTQPGTGADDLLALVDHLGIDRLHLVGTAAGAFVALDFAVSFPQRLRSLVVANSIGGVQDEDYLALGRRLRPAPEFNALPPDVRELGPSYRAGDPRGTARWIELERMSRAEGPPAPAQTMRNRLTFSLLEQLRIPTLLLTGAADLYAPPPVLRLFAARIKNSESVIVPEAGHSAYWEQPEIFNRSVLAFVRKHSQ
jgi:pimeloyl-ACP methyl ester carboxylesterase